MGIKGHKTMKNPLTREQEEALLKACGTEFERQTILILIDTGMHISVLCEPQEHQILVQDEHIQWRRPKTGQVVRMRIKSRIRQFVKEYFESERPTDRRYYHSLIREIGNRIGLIVSPMTFRHTFGVRCFEQGYTINEVQRLMGVRNVSVLMRYVEITDTALDQKMKEKGW